MYCDDINKLYSEKREAKRLIIIDFLKIYIQLKLFFPSLLEERQKLVKLVQLYLDCDANEAEVLSSIKKQYGILDEHEGVDVLLDDFDVMAENLYEHCQESFGDYEDFLAMYGDFIDKLIAKISGKNLEDVDRYRYIMTPRKINFPLFSQEYKNKILMMLPTLPSEAEDFNGEA